MQPLLDLSALLGLEDLQPDSDHLWIKPTGEIVAVPSNSHEDVAEAHQLTTRTALDDGWVKVTCSEDREQIEVWFTAYALRPMAVSVSKSIVTTRYFSRFVLHIDGPVKATLHLVSAEQCAKQIERFGAVQNAADRARFSAEDTDNIVSIMARISGLSADQVVRHAKMRTNPQGMQASDLLSSMQSLGWKLEGMFEMPWMGSPGMSIAQAGKWLSINAPFATVICVVKVDGAPHPILFVDGAFHEATDYFDHRISGVFVCTPAEMTPKTEKKLVTVYDSQGEAMIAPKAAVSEIFDNILDAILDTGE